MRMPVRLARLLCGMVIILLPSGATGAPGASTVTAAALPLASLMEPDGSGLYQRLMARALEPLDVEVREVFYPYRRALQAFEMGQVDCVFSLTDILLERFSEDEVVYSFPLGKFSFHIFTSAEEEPIRSIAGLEGKSVGIIMGHEAYLDSVLGEGFQTGTARNDAQAVRMMGAGRFDAIIAAIPDITPFLDQLNYSPDHPVLESYDRLNCHNTDSNREFIGAVSAELLRLKGAGVYEEEAGELYVPFDAE